MDRVRDDESPAIPTGSVMQEAPQLTPRELRDLLSLVRLRKQVLRSLVAQVKSERLADFEEQVSAVYAWDTNQTWATLHKISDETIAELNIRIAAECEVLNIPKPFRPSLHAFWSERGENATAQRRAELRKAAVTRADADAKAALAQIDGSAASVQERILTLGLASVAAQELLAAMPTPNDLMPRIDMGALDRVRRVT